MRSRSMAKVQVPAAALPGAAPLAPAQADDVIGFAVLHSL